MRLSALLILTLLTLSAPAQKLPAEYPAQVRLLLAPGDIARHADSLEPIARREGNRSFLALLELCRNNTRFAPDRKNAAPLEAALLEQWRSFSGSADPRAEIHSLFVLSEYYWFYGNPGRSIEYGLRAYDRYRNLSGAEFPLKYLALYELASKFYQYQDFQVAARYQSEAMAVRDALRQEDPYIGYNLLGLCFRNEGRYDSAAFYFSRGRELAQRAGSSLWMGIIDGNLGITFYESGRYTDAIPLLEADIAASLNGSAALDNAVNSMAVLAAIHRAQGRQGAAKSLLETAWRITVHEGFTRNHKLMTRLYPQLAELRASEGDLQEAARFWEASSHAKDSLFHQFRASVLAGAQVRVEAERHLAEQKLLNQELWTQRTVRNSLLAGIVLLAVIGVLLIQRMQARHRHRQERAEARLQEAAARLETYTATLHEKNALLERFENELARSNAYVTAEQEVALTELRSLTILTEEEWSRFQELFEQVHGGYLQRLQDALPGLTPADTRYITLRKLHFSNKEIAGVLGIGASSVRTTRSRLRKRLGLSEEEGLDAVIEAI